MSLEQTIDNLQIRNANMVTFVGTSNTMIDTTTGRIQTKGFQHNSNVITDISGPHGRVAPTLKKYPEIAFAEGKFDANESTNTYVQAGYTVSASSVLNSDYHAWRIFDDYLSGNDGWATPNRYNASSPGEAQSGLGATQFPAASGRYGEYVDLQLPVKIKVNHFIIKTRPNTGGSTWIPEDSPGAGYLYGSNDGTTWTEIKAFSGLTYGGTGTDGGTQETVQVDSTTAYKYLRLQATHRAGQNGTDKYVAVGALEYYGYEEDPPAGDHSVDTTFKSRFNNAQTTGVQVLVDGATGLGTNQISGGPDPSGNQSTYVTDGKYWTLNGTLTSNFAVEANTFLEGDQPHAVSVWFNSSNLEANVSNTCVFSIASEEKLDSQNLDLQSNTWHNLTYAYQGEGGSRVTYLDGRKVAEDQAEDTFGEYPPFAMTGYSQGGYVVSASSENNTTEWLAYNAFSDGVNHWYSADPNGGNAPNYYDGGNGVYTGPANLGTDTGGYTTIPGGEWIRLEMPHKLKLSYVNLECPNNRNEFPGEFYVYGSNDDKHWNQLYLAAFPQFVDAGGSVNHSVNAMNAYKYLAIVATRSHVDSGASYARIGYVGIGEIKFYGHRENDLVRLPDPTNVLKYPHIAMTGPAQRGYVATASSLYEASDDYHEWKPFDGSASNDYGAWLSEYDPVTYDGTGNPNSTDSLGNIDGVATPVNGSWLKLELPHKLKLSKVLLYRRHGIDQKASLGFIYGSNDDVNWTTIGSIANGTNLTTYTDTTPMEVTSTDTTNSYKYFTVHVTKVDGSYGYASFGQVEFYGTGVDSIPIQIGGGNIDKVANFRVYDKFIGEDQALEIWDAQKEEFGRAKPQMVLQQGKLGIGTDAPQGSLSVADEPHNLEEFPPRAMTAEETYIEGHGEFCVSTSNVLSEGYTGYKAFNKNSTATAGNWWTQSDLGGQPTYSTSTGEFSSTDPLYSTNVEGATKFGQWIQIEFPYKINYKYSDIQAPQHSIGRQPRAGYIVGSNDLSGIWTSLHRFTNVTRTHAYESVKYTPPTVSTQTFKYFRLVIEELNNYAYAGIARWDIFGTREQGQSVLHDGQLTLTKNLTVPRIGPALDADDTPRRDRLVVEYNTSTNPTFEGAVRDTSGRGNDIVMRGNAKYDASEKAFRLDGTSGTYMSGTQNLGTGTPAHTITGWFKQVVSLNNWTYVMFIGTSANGQQSGMLISNTGQIVFDIYNTRIDTTVDVIDGSWYHFAGVFKGGTSTWDNASTDLYINGKLEGSAAPDSGTQYSFNLTGNGIQFGTSTSSPFRYFNGSISNFKLYDVALTPEEVKTLYDMGRTGSVANPQPLHISGPVNVMGDIRYITSRPLALPTMWDHMANGNCVKGVYPIVGRNGGNTIYHVYCEPDWAGGGWMCMAQFAKDGYQVKAHPTNGDLNIFTKGLGDSKNIRWNNTFAVPLNILSLDGNGYDLDVMIVVLGGGYAGRYEGGMRVGSIWRGHQLSVAFNPGTSSYPGASGLASSSDGYSFSTRTPVTNQNYDMRNSVGWYYSCAANANYNGSYNDQGLSDGGYILHQGSLNKVGSIYGAYHSDTGVAYNSQGNTDFACVRIFVRPSVY